MKSRSAQIQAQLDKTLAPALSAHDYIRYLVADKSKRIVAATSRELIGQQDIPEYDSFLTRALAGETCVSTPFPSKVALKDENGRLRTGVPTMYVCRTDSRREFSSRGRAGPAHSTGTGVYANPAAGPRRQFR